MHWSRQDLPSAATLATAGPQWRWTARLGAAPARMSRLLRGRWLERPWTWPTTGRLLQDHRLEQALHPSPSFREQTAPVSGLFSASCSVAPDKPRPPWPSKQRLLLSLQLRPPLRPPPSPSTSRTPSRKSGHSQLLAQTNRTLSTAWMRSHEIKPRTHDGARSEVILPCGYADMQQTEFSLWAADPPLKLVRFFERFRFTCQCHWFRSPWEHCFLLQFPAWWGYVFCFCFVV